jgi:hypothetical protein
MTDANSPADGNAVRSTPRRPNGVRVLSLALIVLAILVFVGGITLGVIQLTAGGDHDKYGTVAIPGQATLELPVGEVVVFYVVDAFPTPGELLDVPAIDYEVRPASGGTPLLLDGDDGREQVSMVSSTRTDIEGLDVREAGSYVVTARSIADPNAVQPKLTFGTAGKAESGTAWIRRGIFFGLGIFGVAILFTMTAGRSSARRTALEELSRRSSAT